MEMATFEAAKEKNSIEDTLIKLKTDVHSLIIKSISDFVASSGAKTTAPGLMEMLRYYPDAIGKYSRPMIMSLCAMSLGAEYEDCILPAAAIQLSEDFVLVHDDIVDKSLLRRGKETLHRIYGVERAINAGDMLHATLEEMLTSISRLNNGKKIYAKFHEIASLTAIGQDMDIYYTGKEALSANEEIYETIAAYKTSTYSVYGPLQIGALIAGAGSNELEALKNIGLPAGIAFQIKDDINDFLGKVPGKDSYGDIKQGKATLLAGRAYSRSSREDRLEMERIYSKPQENKSADEIEWIRKRIIDTGSVEYAMGIKENYEKASIKALLDSKDIIPNNMYSKELLEFIAKLYE